MDYHINSTVIEEMQYRSYNVMILTGSLIRRNQRQENSPIIDEMPLEDPTIDKTTQTQTIIVFLFQLIVMSEILSLEVEKNLDY